MREVNRAHVRRSFDRSHRRKPLRLKIARRRARGGSGADEFVTQVRFGEATAVFVPWPSDRESLPRR
jgi:hypothetical protein